MLNRRVHLTKCLATFKVRNDMRATWGLVIGEGRYVLQRNRRHETRRRFSSRGLILGEAKFWLDQISGSRSLQLDNEHLPGLMPKICVRGAHGFCSLSEA